MTTTQARQTCRGCMTTVGTLPNGSTRPYVTLSNIGRGGERRFHYCHDCYSKHDPDFIGRLAFIKALKQSEDQ